MLLGVHRSKHSLHCIGWTDARRADKRKDLRFVLDATVCSQDGTIFYYQGLHDVASVLLLTLGDKAAYVTLTHLSLCQLRDCTRCVWTVCLTIQLPVTLWHTSEPW